MRAGFALHQSIDVADLRRAAVNGRDQPTLMAWLRDICTICSRAQIAAHRYEAHKALCDQELAARGLTRADLARAAYRTVTGTA